MRASQNLSIDNVVVDGISPPALDSVETDLAVLRILQTEEDSQDGEGVSGGNSGGQDVVSRLPAGEVSLSP